MQTKSKMPSTIRYHTTSAKANTMNISTWQLPKGISADKTVNTIKRIQHYRFSLVHCLNNGLRVLPTIKTTQYILQAYDLLEMKVAIESNSYITHTESQSLIDNDYQNQSQR